MSSLIAEIRELVGELLDELLRGLELAVQRPVLVLLGLHLLHRQRDGAQPGKPLQAPFLGESRCVLEIAGISEVRPADLP